MNNPLILPGNPLFDFTLATSLPPDAAEASRFSLTGVAYVADVESGVLRATDMDYGVWDYLIGGEYEERELIIYGDEDDGED